ncbi:MAG: SDR family NAD(P)-dependent oxidoreductase, partial [Gammaproteobacteria bacterium]
GYARHGFDLVLGYNVVHATPKIGETVGHLRSLLAPGGLLVLVETTRLRRWDEMVWGLTEGWWHYTDERLRGDSPLLGLGAWEELLRGRGFDLVAAYPREERARRTADTGLIVARQPRAPAETDVRSDAAESARIRAAIAAVRDIRRLGGEVLAIPADLADESRMRPVLAQVRERFGEIHGVIHAAGVLGQGLIHTKTPYEARKVFAAKAVGLLLLDKLLAEQGTEPDFLILCASLASVSPIAGQVDYCAANAFLDAYAAYRSGFGRTAAISIDWGFWQELGMIGQAKMPEAWKQRIVDEIREQGRSGAGVEAFRRILAHCPPPQVLVTPDRPDELPLLQVPAVAMARRRPVHHPWFDECVVETPELETYISRLH